MASATFNKDPGAVRPFVFDWTRYLAPTNDTILSASVTVTGLTKGSVSTTSTTVTVWLSGGSDDSVGSAMCEIVTNGGITDQRTATFKVNEQ